MRRSDTTYLDGQTFHNPWPYDAINDLRRFAARRARREAQWSRLDTLCVILKSKRLFIGNRFPYNIGWLRRERRRWQSKQR